jgi:hypothetical protein
MRFCVTCEYTAYNFVNYLRIITRVSTSYLIRTVCMVAMLRLPVSIWCQYLSTFTAALCQKDPRTFLGIFSRWLFVWSKKVLYDITRSCRWISLVTVLRHLLISRPCTKINGTFCSLDCKLIAVGLFSPLTVLLTNYLDLSAVLLVRQNTRLWVWKLLGNVIAKEAKCKRCFYCLLLRLWLPLEPMVNWSDDGLVFLCIVAMVRCGCHQTKLPWRQLLSKSVCVTSVLIYNVIETVTLYKCCSM